MIPLRSRLFVWRLLHNILLILKNLDKISIIVCPLYPRWLRAKETMLHMIFLCEYISKLWFKSPLGLYLGNIPEYDLNEWLKKFIRKEAKEAVELLVTLAHEVWISRNKLCFKGKVTDIDLMISRSLSILSAYKRSNALMVASMNQPCQ